MQIPCVDCCKTCIEFSCIHEAIFADVMKGSFFCRGITHKSKVGSNY